MIYSVRAIIHSPLLQLNLLAGASGTRLFGQICDFYSNVNSAELYLHAKTVTSLPYWREEKLARKRYFAERYVPVLWFRSYFSEC